MISVKETSKFASMMFPGKGAGTGGAYATGSDGLIGTAIDTMGYKEALFRLKVTGKTNSTGGGAATVSIRECDTTATGSYTAITDGIGDSATATFGSVKIASGTTSQGLLQLDLRNRMRFLKAFLDTSTGSTGTALNHISLDIVLSNPEIVTPVSQTALTTTT